MHLIAEKFNFDWPMPPAVHKVDELMLEMEWESLVLKNENKITPWNSKVVERTFLNEFKTLK